MNRVNTKMGGVSSGDEHYTLYDVAKEHIELSIKYLNIQKTSKVACCFGEYNIYFEVLKEYFDDVREYSSFEDFIKNNENRILIDNPPFSNFIKFADKLDAMSIKFSLLASGVQYVQRYGAILFKKPHKFFHSGKPVLCQIRQNFDLNIYSEYNSKNPNAKYYMSDLFFSTAMPPGVFTEKDIRFLS